MKKISRRSFITAMAAVSAAGVLAACGSSSSSTVLLWLLPLYPAKQLPLPHLWMRPVPIPS